jgi:hypothetical protein
MFSRVASPPGREIVNSAYKRRRNLSNCRWVTAGSWWWAGLLRDAVFFQERILVRVEQKFRAMRLEIGEDDAFFGGAKLEVGRAAGIAQELGLPDMRRDLLRQVHGDSLLLRRLKLAGGLFLPRSGSVNESPKNHREKRTPLRLCNGVLKPKGFGIQSWDWTIDAGGRPRSLSTISR